MAIKFLSDDIWTTIKTLSDKSRKTKVAVAYFGTGASEQLHFKSGDILIVAMHLNNLKSGQVNPYEIEKLLDKGVKVFNLKNLHSKIYIFDKQVIIGSANVSSNSKDNLIEAGVLTDDARTVKQAEEMISKYCAHRVNQDYVEYCKEHYVKPKFSGQKTKSKTTAKFKGELQPLWVLSTKEDNDIDDEALEKDQEKWDKKISNKRTFEVDEIWYPINDKQISKIKAGDILYEIYTTKHTARVIQPKIALGFTYDRPNKKVALRVEERKKPIKKSWSTLETFLRRNGVKNIKRSSTKEITNENTKKLLLDYFN